MRVPVRSRCAPQDRLRSARASRNRSAETRKPCPNPLTQARRVSAKARSRPGRKARHHFFEKKSRPVGVPRLEMALPGFDRPPPSVGVIGRREHSCPVPELRCGLRSATCSCPSGSILDGRGHLGIGTARSEGEMERLLVRIVDDLRQAGVHFASPSRRCLRRRPRRAADVRTERGRRRPPGLRRLPPSRARPPHPTAGGGSHELDGRPRERRDNERLPRRGRDSG